MQYKWIALTNTTLGVLMGAMNGTILLISLPAIFRGIGINPFNSFQYLLWVLFGYNIATATLLVTFGRISDMFGRVRLYNLGFLIFTIGSILLFLTPGKGNEAALEIIFFRLVQGVGAAFLMANSAAIITDAFGPQERGKALGLNQVAALAGSLLGLILGGILAVLNWRYVFLVSVPFGIAGTIWSYTKLREMGKITSGQKIDYLGNLLFGAGLIFILIGVTYGLLPYGNSSMGWGDPWVITSIAAGLAMLVVFPFVEKKVKYPMFRLELFKLRPFAMGSIATLLSAIAFGGVQIILIILLQGIWLPLHGYSYSSTPFWAGVYMIPLSLGFVTLGPISGRLSDKYGSRLLSTLGMIVVAISFLALLTLPYNFNYADFAVIIYVMGLGNGLFIAPNTASIMNSVPPEHRGSASGMRSTFQNVGQTTSIAIFFSIVIYYLGLGLSSAFNTALASSPALAHAFSSIPPTGALFAAFLGYDPVKTVLGSLPPSIASSINPSILNTITQRTWFPTTIAPPFMRALDIAFIISAIISIGAAISSYLRGKQFIYERDVIGEVQRTG
ncbi:MFS transporter [Sulfolobales archaeon HS-7]|nr:MFS transporter [Sulfolobales archaeon HS-7]